MGFQGNGPFFTLRGVSKTFRLPRGNPFKPRAAVRALDSVDLEVPRGEITCLLGPNGAGKTTLIKILADLITPDSGEIRHDGLPAAERRKELAGKIGLVTPNERSFYWRLSGRENLLFFGRLHGYRGRELASRVDRALEETGMQADQKTQYRLYSAGAKQKLNIARALLGDGELYLLDEPAAHLDPVAREEFRAFVRETLVGKRGAAVFLCTHDLEEATVLADRLAILDSGRVVAHGPKAELLGSSGGRRELVIAHAGEIPAAWLAERGSAVSADGPGRFRLGFEAGGSAKEELIASFVRSGGRLLEVVERSGGLLDLIKRMTGKHA